MSIFASFLEFWNSQQLKVKKEIKTKAACCVWLHFSIPDANGGESHFWDLSSYIESLESRLGYVLILCYKQAKTFHLNKTKVTKKKFNKEIIFLLVFLHEM